MFPGPTGTNTVESALKIARKMTGRETVVSFTNAFHGMTLGALSVTGNLHKRKGAGIPLSYAVSMPYDAYFEGDTALYLERYLSDGGSGVDRPAAVILETVQGEGGMNAADFDWIKRISDICRKYDILLIIDDVQAGNGRTGTFFSFEPAGIEPDIICLSKSVGGSGLPMAVTLIKPEYDQWAPGEHNGTSRGNNLALITAAEALEYWKDNAFEISVKEKSAFLKIELKSLIHQYPELKGVHRGRGLMQGIKMNQGLAVKICAAAFKNGLIVETSGPDDEVVKFLPPLIVNYDDLKEGLKRLEAGIKEVLNHSS